MQIGDLVKSVIDDPSVHTQRVLLVTETRINWIKVLGFPSWYRVEDWMVICENR